MWNERYNTKEYIYGKDPNDFLVSVTKNMTPKSKILCIGEGEGRNAVFLAKLGFNVTALDQSENALIKAKKLAEENNVDIETISRDLNNYQIKPNTFDVIISIFCHLPEKLRKNVNKNILESLKPGGFLIMEIFSKAQITNNTGGPKSLEMLVSLSEVENDFSDLHFIIKKEMEREIHEGSLHNGKSSVIQVLATKLVKN